MTAEFTDKKEIRSDLLKREKESKLDLAFIAAEAGDIRMSEFEVKRHLTLKKERGKNLYKDMLFLLTNQNFSSGKAKKLWTKLLKHKEELTRILGRNPGIAVAALDFLTNIGVIDERIALIQEGKMMHVTAVAVKDGMTGLYDHASFQTKLHEELVKFDRHGIEVSLIMADVDFFKQYNDTYGHKEGDVVLKDISSCIRDEIREIDIGARYGGEEFAIIACTTDVNEAYLLAERIRKRIRKEFLGRGNITMSFGVAGCKQIEGSRSCLVTAADSALYEAKMQGRDRTVLYQSKLSSHQG